MSPLIRRSFLAGLALALFANVAVADTTRWPPEKANAWYAQQRWLVGSNYIPADAINQPDLQTTDKSIWRALRRGTRA